MEMKVDVEQRDGFERELAVTIPPKEVDKEFRSHYQGLQRNVRLKGFRPGKVPLQVIKGRYGAHVRSEVQQHLIQHTYAKALADHGLEPVSDPDFDLPEPEEGKEYGYKVRFEVKPTFDLDNYTGLEVEIPSSEVTDEAVRESLERLRKRRGEAKVVEDEPAAQGDEVVIDFDGRKPDGTPLDRGTGTDAKVELGAGTFIADLEAGIVGMKAGEERKIPVSFPDDYFEESLRDEKAEFTVTVKEVRKLDLPELDDGFAADFGIDEIKTLEDLKARVREDLESNAKNEREQILNRAIMDKIIETNDVPAPEGMVKRELRSIADQYREEMKRHGVDLGGRDIDPEKLREEHGDEATRRVKARLALEEIADLEGLAVGDQEVRDEVANLAGGAGQPVEKVWASLEQGGQIKALRRSLVERKVFEYLRTATKVRETDQAS